MFTERTKEDRARWLKQTLAERGIPAHGMRKEIMERLDIAAGTVDRLLRGSTGSADIAGRLAHSFDFLYSDFIWSDFNITKALGPNRKLRLVEQTAELHDAHCDSHTEKTLRTLLHFITDNYLPDGRKASDGEWQENVVKAFFIFNKTLKAGLSPEQVLEMGTTMVAFKNPLDAAGEMK